MYRLNAKDQGTVIHALRVAADTFMDDSRLAGQPERLVKQFENQAVDARTLADAIENNGDAQS